MELQASIEVLSSQAARLQDSTSHEATIACTCLKVAPPRAISHSCLGSLNTVLILQSSAFLLSEIKKKKKEKKAGKDLQSQQSQKILGLVCICQEQSSGTSLQDTGQSEISPRCLLFAGTFFT